MASYVFIYKGGSMAPTPEEQQAVMAAWGAWFGTLGAAVKEPGAPFGPSKSVASNGSVSDGASSKAGGYSVIEADDLARAADMAKGCPVLGAGGSVEVYETIPM
ncbi:MAG TPA: YciI family protein [Candidatus Baltobacteraceae bacterium]|nr:YciI family protein [Candidatus Baltobacteraceae bacterium]